MHGATRLGMANKQLSENVLQHLLIAARSDTDGSGIVIMHSSKPPARHCRLGVPSTLGLWGLAICQWPCPKASPLPPYHFQVTTASSRRPNASLVNALPVGMSSGCPADNAKGGWPEMHNARAAAQNTLAGRPTLTSPPPLGSQNTIINHYSLAATWLSMHAHAWS
jgi:hypothetical protein